MKAREWKRERTAPGRIRRAVAIVAPDCITGKFRIFMGAHARSPSREIMRHSPFQSTLARLSRKLLHCERSSIKLSPSLSISPSLSREWEREAIFTLLPAYVRVCRFFLSLPPRLFFLPPPSLLSTSITFFSLSARSPCPSVLFTEREIYRVATARVCTLSLFPWFSHSLTRFFSRASAIALTVLFLWLAGREQAPLDARAFKIGRVRCLLLLSSPLHLPFVPVSASHFCMFFLFHLVFRETVCVCVCATGGNLRCVRSLLQRALARSFCSRFSTVLRFHFVYSHGRARETGMAVDGGWERKRDDFAGRARESGFNKCRNLRRS